MSGLDIDTRSDIYSLGVLLYELLTGGTPFDTKELLRSGLDEMRKIIREREPARPSTRLSQTISSARSAEPDRAPSAQSPVSIDPDLDWIVMKCLEKDRTRRYETANGLAADLRRHLANEPVVARPPTAAYRFQKAWRRNRLVYAAGAAVASALFVGSGISLWQAHRANQEKANALMAEAQAREEESNAKAALYFIQDDILSQAHPELQPDRNLTVRDLIDRVVKRLDSSDQHPPMVEAAIRQTIGSIYTELGEYPEAVHNYQIALVNQRRHLGTHHPETLRSLYGLAMNRWWSGDMVSAESLTKEGFAASRQALGERDPLTVQFMQARALALAFQGARPWLELERFFFRTLDLHRELFGLDDPRTLRLIYGFGLSCTIRGGSTERIKPLVTEAVHNASRTLGENHPLTGALMAIMSQLHWTLKEFSQAEAFARRCVETRQARLGESHPLTVNAMLGLARMQVEQGDFASARRLTDRVEELNRRKAIDTFPLWASQLSAIGVAFLRQGEIAQSETFCLKAYEAMQRKQDAFPAGHGPILYALARVRLAQARYQEAEQLLRQSLELVEKYTPNGTFRWIVANDLGISAARQRKYAEAESLLLESCEELLQRRSDMSPIEDPQGRLAQAHQELIELYERAGHSRQAAVWRRKLAELDESAGAHTTSGD